MVDEPYIEGVSSAGVRTFRHPNGATSRFADPNVPFGLRRELTLLQAEAAEQRAAQLRLDLRSALTRSNPVQAYLAIAALERRSRRKPPTEVFGYDALVDYLAGVVTSLPEAVIRAGGQRELEGHELFRIESLLRELAKEEGAAGLGSLADERDGRHGSARFMLMHEEQFDRMAGYTQHISLISHSIFEPMSEMAMKTMGTTPLRVLEVAELHSRRQEAILGTGFRPPDDIDPADRASIGLKWLSTMADALGCDVAETMQQAGFVASEVEAVAAILKTPLSSQDVWTLRSPNRARRFPIIESTTGALVWARPYDFQHEVLEWFDQVLLDGKHDKLRTKLSEQRARVTEQLTADAFSRVFGTGRVMTAVEYELDADRWAETDVLVDVATTQLVVEAKSHRFTPRGRAGDAARVRTKFEELVTAPLRQSDRTRQALASGARLRNKRTGKPIAYAAPTKVHRVVVLLDRVDPFVATARARTDEGGPLVDAWIVSLADLLMVTEILKQPSELYPYINSRIEQTSTGSPLIITESDALGAWLKSREGAWPVEAGVMFTLEHSSDAVNAYFTGAEMHDRYPDLVGQPEPLGSGIPVAVTDAMNSLLAERDPLWETAAVQVGLVQPTTWTHVERDERRVQTRPTTRQQRKARDAARRGRHLHKNLTLVFGDLTKLDSDGTRVVLTLASPADAALA